MLIGLLNFLNLAQGNVIQSIIENHQNSRYNDSFTLIMVIIVFNFILEKVLNWLNAQKLKVKLPKEIDDVYQPDEYKKSQEYKSVNERFSLITSTFSFSILILMLVFHIFGYIDSVARSWVDGPVWIALTFFGIIMFASDLINTPFALYDTFVIEERFGFNKTTLKLFFLDKIKSWVLMVLIGGGVTALIIYLYGLMEDMFWIYAWILVSAFMIFMSMFYSTLIVPLFNKQTPLEDGPLRDAINDFSKKVGFKLDNIFVIDGSKRSTKANAYFTGLGSKKRIVLYDTLINDLSVNEIVAVLAHEIGHYKKKHTLIGIVLGIIQLGITLYVFSLFTSNPRLSYALGADTHSLHMIILAFGIIYSPISTVVGLGLNVISRKNEYQADHYVKENYEENYLISALKKLSSKNLSNLTPHPAYVFFYYSHPTLLQRIKALHADDKKNMEQG